MKYFTKEVNIAIVSILAVVTLFFGLKFLKGLSLVSQDTTYYINFTNISGLGVTSVVYADGYRVGTVTDIEYDYEHPGNIRVAVDLNPELRIPKGTTATIESDMLGNVKVNLTMQGNPTVLIQPGGDIPGIVSNGALAMAAEMVPQIQALMPKLDSILTSVNRLLADPALQASLHNVEGITNNLNTTTANLNSMMAQMNTQMPGLMKKADGVMTNAETITSNFAAINVQETMNKIDQTLANVQAMTDKINNPTGTMGKLLNDPSIYDNLNATMRDADSLMIDLKAHPKRYVHFSVFGKKDK